MTIGATQLLSDYVDGYMHYVDGSWAIGKGLSKLAMIAHSEAWEKVDHSQTKAHIKREGVTKAKSTKTRGIQASDNECTAYEHPIEYAAVGHALKGLGSQKYNIPGTKTEVRFHYAGGMNHSMIAELLDELQDTLGCAQILWDEADMANCDASMNQTLNENELAVYEYLALRAAQGVAVTHQPIRGVMSTPRNTIDVRRIRYVTMGKRLSGKWNTTAGNVITLIEVRYWTLKHLPPHLQPDYAVCVHLGDDYIGRYLYKTPVDPNELAKALNDLDRMSGVQPERGLFPSVFDVSFISLGVWPTHDGKLAMVPHIGRQCKKLFWTANANGRTNRDAIGSSIAEAFWPTYYGCEMMMRLLKYHNTTDKRVAEVWYHQAMLTNKQLNVDWAWGFNYKYGIGLDQLPKDLPTERGSAYVLHHPVVSHLLAVESVDTWDRPRCVGRE